MRSPAGQRRCGPKPCWENVVFKWLNKKPTNIYRTSLVKLGEIPEGSFLPVIYNNHGKMKDFLMYVLLEKDGKFPASYVRLPEGALAGMMVRSWGGSQVYELFLSTHVS